MIDRAKEDFKDAQEQPYLHTNTPAFASCVTPITRDK